MTDDRHGTTLPPDDRIDAIETRWSLIRNAHRSGDPVSAADARRRLVLRYAVAIRRFVGAIIRDRDAADELAQEVLVRLMRGDFENADPARGRFRELLKTAIRNMVKSWWEQQSRRASVAVDLDLLSAGDDHNTDSVWQQLWRSCVLDHTWDRLRHETPRAPGATFWALRLKADSPNATADELARQLTDRTGSPVTATNARQILGRARRRFAAYLMDELRAALDAESDAALREELATLGLLDYVRDYLPGPS